MMSDRFSSGPRSESNASGRRPLIDPHQQPDTDHWSERLREIDLRDRELTYHDLTYSAESAPEVSFEALPGGTGLSAPRAGWPPVGDPIRSHPIAEPATTPLGASPIPAAPHRQLHQPVTWRKPTQRTEDIAARNGRVALPATHQAALVVVAALGTGAGAFLLSGDSWGRTPMAVAALVGIPGLASISLVTAHHRMRPERRTSHPTIAGAIGIALALASLAAVSLLGAWGALAAIIALVAVAWWVSSASRKRQPIDDDVGRPMAPVSFDQLGVEGMHGSEARSAARVGRGTSDTRALDDGSTFASMMDVFAPDLPGDRATPPLELARTPARWARNAPVPPLSGDVSDDSSDATDDLLGWIADTYSPLK